MNKKVITFNAQLIRSTISICVSILCIFTMYDMYMNISGSDEVKRQSPPRNLNFLGSGLLHGPFQQKETPTSRNFEKTYSKVLHSAIASLVALSIRHIYMWNTHTRIGSHDKECLLDSSNVGIWVYIYINIYQWYIIILFYSAIICFTRNVESEWQHSVLSYSSSHNNWHDYAPYT